MYLTPRVLITLLVTASVAMAQQTFTERMNARFEKRAPLVGDILPNVSGFTADGVPFAFDADYGKVTVLVFGCLT